MSDNTSSGQVVIPALSDLINKSIDEYTKEFNAKPHYCGIAPGRVNLIGEHTDYNDGYVLPMAIPLYTVVVGRKSGSSVCTVVTSSEQDDRRHEFLSTNLQPGPPLWCNYIKGVISNFAVPVDGFNAYVHSSVPIGGGLSSSASLEVATFSFLEALSGLKTSVDKSEKAKRCQKAEHEFANVPCGIMDQLIVSSGSVSNALLIDCRSLNTEPIPLSDTNVVILITNSNVKHQLTGSEYSSRRQACYDICTLLNKDSLRDVSLSDLESSKSLISYEMFKYGHHVVSEIERTLEAAEALRGSNYVKFGQLMVESHVSLRDDYKVSCYELDELVTAALEVDGVYGSRMTGGGFGGCTVTLMKADAITATIKHMQDKYSGQATFYVCQPCDGSKYLLL